MRKLLTIVIASVVLGTVVFFAMQLYVNAQTKRGALQVLSSPQSKVYLGNTYLGQTPLCKCKNDNYVASGTYTVRLIPNDSKYAEYRERITVTQGVLTVVDRKFNTSGLTGGSTISLVPLTNKDTAELSVLSIPEQATILLDDKELGKTPYLDTNATEADHILRINKPGYIEKSLRIRTRKAYKLIIQTELDIDPSVATGQQASASALLNTTPTSTASPEAKIVILDTPTGFLNVRSESTVTSKSIGQVNPGGSYFVVDQRDGWYEIQLDNGKQGWVSSRYAKKE